MIKEENKDLAYWKANAEEDYMQVPISVLRYITELETVVKNCSIPVVVRSAFLVQHKDTLINHGLFDSEEKAKKYINGCNTYAIQEVQIA